MENINDTELTSMEEIRKQINSEKQETALGTVNFSNLVVKEEKKGSEEKQEVAVVNNSATEAAKLIGDAHKQAIVATIQNKEEVQERVLNQAEKSIDNELKSLEQENIQRLQKTTYDANKEACSNYGINNDVPLWQINLMRMGSAVWFVIYWIVASLIICPINVFCKGLKAFIKQGWLVLIIGVILYLVIAVGVPFLITILA